MDNEMIERVAEAIFKKRYEADGTYRLLKWADYKGKDFYLEDAKAAIKAMRDPTEKMCNQGAMEMPDYDPTNDDAKTCWINMIDAVIND